MTGGALRRPCAWALALLLAALVFAASASAAELVSNTGQSTGTTTLVLGSGHWHAQRFTTGANTGGYTLTDVELDFDTAPASGISVKIVSGLSTSSVGTAVATLTNPTTLSTGTLTFTAPANTTLDASTEYAVVVNGGAPGRLRTTDGTGESGATGWTIADKRSWRSGTDNYTHPSSVIRILVNGAAAGTDTTVPTFDSATVNGATLTLNYSEALDTGSTPATTDFTVSVAGTGKTPTAVSVSGSSVTLTLDTADAVTSGQRVTVSYTAGTNPIRDKAQNNAANLSGQSVYNVTGGSDTTAPTFSSAFVNGSSLTLNYSEALDTTSVPATTDFTVSVAGTDQTPTGVTVSGSAVTLTLATAATAGQAVTVSYTAGTNPIRDLAQNNAGSLSSQSVTSDTTPPPISTPPPTSTLVKNTDQSTVSSNQISSFIWDHRLSFTTGGSSEGYRLTAVDLAMQTGGTGWYNMRILDASGTSLGRLNNPTSRTAGLNRHTVSGVGIDLAANTTYQILIDVTRKTTTRMQATTSGEEDAAMLPGWSIADIAEGRNATTHPAWDDSDRVPKIAIRGHAKDTTAPTLVGARVDGTTLTLNYNEQLDTGSTPDTTDFTVSVGGSNQTVSQVAVSGVSVTLTLGTAATAGQAVTVSYTAGTNRIRNAALIYAANLRGEAVTNTTGVTKPTVTSSGVAIVSTATDDTDSNMIPDTYHLGALIKVQLTFTEAVTVIGTPRLKIKLDSASGEKWANYESGSGTTQLTFAYKVVSPDTSTQGIAVLENTLQLNGGVIKSTSSQAAATLTHGGLAHDVNHKVDSSLEDTTAPTLQSAQVHGTTLTLNYSEALDTGSVPATTDFTISVAGTNQTPIQVVVSGSAVTLILATAATAGQAVTVSYTVGTNPIRDEAANNASGLSNQTVTNNTGAPTPQTPSTPPPPASTPQASTAPSFGGAVVEALTLDRGMAMKAVALPQATGGEGALTYSLASEPAGLAGLNFDPATRTLSGAPGTSGNWTFTYRAEDADANRTDADAAVLRFEVKVTVLRRAIEAVKGALAGVARRTLSSALGHIGARFADVVPPSGATLAGYRLATAPEAACLPGGYGERPSRGGHEAACASSSHEVASDALLHASAFHWTPEAPPGEDPAPRWSVWGRGDYAAFEGRPEAVRYEGETRTGWLGMDVRSGPWVAGVALSHGVAEADYEFGEAADERGRLETTLSALYPYGRWRFANGLEVRAVLGAGNGEARHARGAAARESSDLSMWLASVGVWRKLPAVAGVDLSVRADASLVRIETAGGVEEISGISADAWRGRLGLETSRRFATGEDSALTPFVEAVGRRDGGDGLEGTGLEMAGGVRWSSLRFEVEARGRVLVAHTEEGARERGVSVTVRLRPAPDGRGLSLALTPRWGAGTGGAEALWREDMPQVPGVAEQGVLDARVGYGVAWPRMGGLLTPFAETSAGSGSRRLRLGTRFEAARADLGVEFAGERTESGADDPVHGLRLDLSYRF